MRNKRPNRRTKKATPARRVKVEQPRAQEANASLSSFYTGPDSIYSLKGGAFGKETEFAIKIMDKNAQVEFNKEKNAFDRLKGCKYIMQACMLFQDPATSSFCIVMPYIRLNLQERLDGHYKAPPGDWAYKIIRQILYGIGTIHAKGLIHRDLKTTNILIAERDEIKISDFGTTTN